MQVVGQSYQKWPARGDKPAGEGFSLLLMDMSKPFEHRMHTNVQYRLQEDEVNAYWGVLEDRTVNVSVHEIMNGEKKPVLRGKIVEVVGGLKDIKPGTVLGHIEKTKKGYAPAS